MRVLIFGTVYADTQEKQMMANRWACLHGAKNPDCDLALFDSGGTLRSVLYDSGRLYRTAIYDTGPNIGHLARGGKDGWGRAFEAGLGHGTALDYDYIAHVEGDSLFRLPVLKICRQMREEGFFDCYTVPVRGTKRVELDWIETGLMIFSHQGAVRVLKSYDWKDCEPKRKYPQTPEWHMHNIVKDSMRLMPWSAERGDRGHIVRSTVGLYDWITHVSDDVAEAFMRDAL